MNNVLIPEELVYPDHHALQRKWLQHHLFITKTRQGRTKRCPPPQSLHARWISAFPKSPAYSWSFRSVSPARMVTYFLPAGLLAQGDWSDRNSCWAPPAEVSLFGNQEIHTHKSLSCELQGLESYISQVA